LNLQKTNNQKSIIIKMKIYIPIGSNCEISHILRNNNLRLLKKDNEIYIEKIKELYKDHKNIQIKSLEEIFK